MLKWILSIALWLTVTGKPKQPHILYIVTDDMGWSDVGFPEGKASVNVHFILYDPPRRKCTLSFLNCFLLLRYLNFR